MTSRLWFCHRAQSDLHRSFAGVASAVLWDSALERLAVATPDKVFKQTYAWYKASIDQLLSASAIPAAERPAVAQLLWQVLGVLNSAAPPANPDLSDFRDNGAAAESMAIACQVVSETLAALGYVKDAVDGLQGGNPASALAVVGPVMEQIDRLTQLQANSRYPSAFSIGKMLLMLSGDAQANPPVKHEADKVAALFGAVSAADVTNAQAAVGMVSLVVGSMLDRSFTAPSNNPAAGFITQAIPSFAGKPSLSLSVPGGLNGTVAFDPGPPSALKAALNLAFNRSQPIGGTNIAVALTASAGVDVMIPVAPPSGVKVSGNYAIGLDLRRKGNALTIGGDELGVTLSVGELGIALQLANGAPSLTFIAHDAKAVIKPSDGFLKLILGDGITVALDVSAQADAAGKLRLINGTGLRASLPVPTLPTGPFELQLINLGLDPEGGSFTKLSVEVSASFGVALGPFAASVDRLGILLKLDLGGGTPIAFAFKPPNGIGLSLDAGIVKGGGFLLFDPDTASTRASSNSRCSRSASRRSACSTRKFPGRLVAPAADLRTVPRRSSLSFGFTLTGIGGLIGVQHTASPPALSQALSAGSLDAVLFPDNPVANAPQIFNTLRTLFPFKAGGFIIGPMLELGWGPPASSPSAWGCSSRPSQFVDPRPGRSCSCRRCYRQDLALLYLQSRLRRRRGLRPAEDRVRRQAARFARRLHLAHRPVRLSRHLRRQAQLPHQRRRLPSALQRHSARHSIAVRPHRRRVLDSASSASVQRLLRGHLGHRPGRLRDARVGRRRRRQLRGRPRLRRHRLSRRRSSTSRSTSSRPRRVTSSASTSRRSIWTARSPDRDAGTSPAMPRSTRRGRCRTSRSTSTSTSATTSRRRRSPSTFRIC